MSRIPAWIGLVMLLPAGAALAAVDAGEPGEQRVLFRTGDMLQVGVPLVGLALTFALEPLQGGHSAPGGALSWSPSDATHVLSLDGSPRHDFMAAALRMELVTYSLKFSVNEQRPNGGEHSFPSGHTASAFMGAEFIRKEYGWGWAAPAYVAASYVGWSRVASDNHYTRDVVAGAAIGILSNHNFGEFTGRYGTISITPAWIGAFAEDARGVLADGASTPGIGMQVQMLFGN